MIKKDLKDRNSPEVQRFRNRILSAIQDAIDKDDFGTADIVLFIMELAAKTAEGALVSATSESVDLIRKALVDNFHAMAESLDAFDVREAKQRLDRQPNGGISVWE